jgi:pyridoxal 5'-phosphate synthase pdxS subunit
MAKARIGHFVEAQILQALGVDFVDESEVLTPADEAYHIDKHAFTVPFVCGATNIGEALRRIGEGAAMIRTKGEAGTGNVVEAVRHARSVIGSIRLIQAPAARGADDLRQGHRRPLRPGRLRARARQAAGRQLRRRRRRHPGRRGADDAARRRRRVRRLGHLQVGRRPHRQGAQQAWFRRAEAIVRATTHYQDPDVLAEVSRGLGEPMVGINIDTLREEELLAGRAGERWCRRAGSRTAVHRGSHASRRAARLTP